MCGHEKSKENTLLLIIKRPLTIEDHRQFISFQRLAILSLLVEVEGVFEHSFLLSLLIGHEGLLLVSVTIVISCAASYWSR